MVAGPPGAGSGAMNCKNCGEPIVWVPDRGGRWTHYRADVSCGQPEPGDPPVQPWETVLSGDGDLG